MSITKDEIIAELKTVFDPEISLDIWTMGLIYEINIKSDEEVHVLMTYTTPMCPFGPQLTKQIEEKITDLGAKKVEVEVTFSPPWKASDELRTILGI